MRVIHTGLRAPTYGYKPMNPAVLAMPPAQQALLHGPVPTYTNSPINLVAPAMSPTPPVQREMTDLRVTEDVDDEDERGIPKYVEYMDDADDEDLNWLQKWVNQKMIDSGNPRTRGGLGGEDSTAHIAEPMFSDTPFSQSYPPPPALTGHPCWCCLQNAVPLPKVRGIPPGTEMMSQQETSNLLTNLSGNWKLTPLSVVSGNMVAMTDALFRDDYMILSGGMHNTTQTVHGGHSDYGRHTIQTAVANQTQKQSLHFMRGNDGTIYLDYMGSVLKNVDFAGGEIVVDNALGYCILFQRGWKFNGLAPPQQEMNSQFCTN